jgi:hypothetical protein
MQKLLLQMISKTLHTLITQGVHKRASHFQHNTENKCCVLRISVGTETLSSANTRYVSASHTADIETIIQVFPNFCSVPVSLVIKAMAVVIR